MIPTIGKYILKDKKIIPCEDLIEWGKWLETRERIIKQQYIGKFFVSTVFLGLDHGFGIRKKPVLFETMIFDRSLKKDEARDIEEYQTRCCTYSEALKMHKKAVNFIKNKKGVN